MRPALTSVPSTRVTLYDADLGPRVAAARAVVDACLDRCAETGRIANFAAAAGLAPGPFRGRRYDDSDVYKTLEGAARLLVRSPDAALRARVDEVVAAVAAAQRPDGYLNTWYTLVEPARRWIDLKSSHELYCAGHLLEAALALDDAGDGRLLAVARRFLDLIDAEFGPGRRPDPPGHQEIEIALLALARRTGERRWRDLAAFFLEARGRHAGRPPYGEYAQDHLPVREQREAAGHAVRALYQYCAMADLAAADGDEGLLEVARAAFDDVTRRKQYVTGGVGARGETEGFGAPFELPVDGAYCETCASIALAMLSRRLLLLTGEARYADAFEHVVRNALFAGVALDGGSFFYVNPLADGGAHRRQPWFACACCPTNLARFLPVLPGDLYAVDSDTLLVAQYASSEAEIDLAGQRVVVDQHTHYPCDGGVTLRLHPKRPAEFTVALRVPSFAAGSVPGERDGWLRFRRRWSEGDDVSVRFPLAPVRIAGRPEVAGEQGMVAVRHGPLVYCAEAADNAGRDPRAAALPPGAALSAHLAPDLLGGAVVVEAATAPPLRLIPYSRWANRAPGPMAVWFSGECGTPTGRSPAPPGPSAGTPPSPA